MKKLAAFIVLATLLNIVANAEEYVPSTIESELSSVVSEEVVFDVTVPTSLPIYVSSTGEVATASGISITNNSTHPVKISGIEVTTNNGWNILNPSVDIVKLLPGGKGFQLEILGISVDETGIINDPNTSIIASGESLEIAYSAHVQTQTDSIAESVADISFTVDWSEPVTTHEIVTIPEISLEEKPIESENVTLPDENSSIEAEDDTENKDNIKVEDIIDTPLDSDINQGEITDNSEESNDSEVESELKPNEVPKENPIDTPTNSEASTENTENSSDSTVNADTPSNDADKVEIDTQNIENTSSILGTAVEPDSSQICVELGSTDVNRPKEISKENMINNEV